MNIIIVCFFFWASSLSLLIDEINEYIVLEATSIAGWTKRDQELQVRFVLTESRRGTRLMVRTASLLLFSLLTM